MIIQSKETKGQTSLIDLLGGNTKNSSSSKSNDMFSKLLATFGKQPTSDEPKIVKSTDFKAIIDPKNVSTKNADPKSAQIKELQALLTGSDEKESKLISTEFLGNLSNDQVRTLINRAKDYLKNEITAKSPEYQEDQKALPKTLGGLIKLAEKLGLEPQSISLSTLVKEPEEQASFSLELLSKPLFETKAVAALPATIIKEESPMEAITQLLSELKGKEQKSTKSTSTETSTQEKSEKADTQPLKTLLQNIDKPTTEVASASVTDKSEPLKISPVTTTSTAKSDALIALLQGVNEKKETSGESSSTQKVESESTKTFHVPKAESLEVKSKEAQQSMRLFASDLKEAVQEYKPPFTRLTMKLNPEKLGEVEVTLVQRGNNVHVNIQSNNTNSVAFLAHNATELKAQLASQGITNATMNFMSGGDSQGNQQQTGQQQQEQQKNRFRAYESFEDLELNKEQLSALEIIIPHYA